MSGDDRPPRPDALPVDPDGFPDVRRGRHTWVCWRYEYRDDEWRKVPIDPATGTRASATDDSTWHTFQKAWDYHSHPDTDTDGVGYVFTDAGPIVGVDLDDCRDPDTGDLDQWAQDVLDALDGYAEVSTSGTGVHVWVRGALPDADGNRSGKVEMYDTERYFAVTGQHIDGTPDTIPDRQDALAAVHAEHVGGDRETDPAEDRSPGSNQGVTSEKPPSGDGFDGSDADLIENAKNAENGDYFTDLWNGRWRRHTHRWPGWSPGNGPSEADAALCNLLAFWTGDDRERIDRLFRQSGLMREKWERDDYPERTINKALDGRTEFYDPDATATDGGGGDAPSATTGTWENVRELYGSSDVTKGTARAAAVDLLTEREHFAAMCDTEELYRYNPETGIYEPGGEKYVGNLLDGHLGPHYSTHERGEVVARLKDRTWTDRGAFGGTREDPRICLGNGVLDLATGDLAEHSPEGRFTRRLPWEWDPDADCPAFDAFLDDVVETAAAKRTVYEVLGLAIHPGYLKAGFLTLYGDGRNGKSTLLEAVERFLGPENVAGRSLQTLASDDHATADLYGKQANICADLPGDKLPDTGMLKQLTGGDAVTANPKYKQPFTFHNEAALIFSANDPPKIDDDSTALARRLLLVNCPNEFTPAEQPGPDLRPKQDLLAGLTTPDECAGILRRATEAAQRIRETGQFSQAESAEQVREHYKRVSDPVYAFATECLDDDTDEFVPTDDLYAAYVAWCRENDAPTKDKNVLTRTLHKHVRMEKARRKVPGRGRKRGYTGIALTGRGDQLLGGDDPDDDQQTGLT